jgi:hypothetical protein
VLLWQAWKDYAHRATGYQTRVLLTIVYLLVLGPGAILGRLFGARLLDLDQDNSSWAVRAPQDRTLDGLRRQF